ncbi:MAG: NodS-like protein [Pseudonocardiales bacterium]|nr:NodS-like protein [Pseudonocardiales bacterium]
MDAERLHNGAVANSVAGTAEHWDEAYGHGDSTRGWYQTRPAASLRMLDRCSVTPEAGVIDVGGGASTLVDALLARGHTDVTVLDISAAALAIAQRRLEANAIRVEWQVVDLVQWQPERTYGVWHDRAVFHFLTTAHARHRYFQALRDATGPGAVAVIATFAPDGPEQCSGLPVARYSPSELAAQFGSRWKIIAEDREEHTTPAGAVQPFTWAAFRR